MTSMALVNRKLPSKSTEPPETHSCAPIKVGLAEMGSWNGTPAALKRNVQACEGYVKTMQKIRLWSMAVGQQGVCQ